MQISTGAELLVTTYNGRRQLPPQGKGFIQMQSLRDATIDGFTQELLYNLNGLVTNQSATNPTKAN